MIPAWESWDKQQLADAIRRAEADVITMRADVAFRAQRIRNLEHWVSEYRVALIDMCAAEMTE